MCVDGYRAFYALLSSVHRASDCLLSSAGSLREAAIDGHIGYIEADGPVVGLARHLL